MRNRKWLWSLLLIPVILAGGAAWYITSLLHRFTMYAPVARTLPAELAAAKREGLPIEAADLHPKPPIPDSQNAAPFYVRIDRSFRSRPEAEQKADGQAESGILRVNSTESDRAAASAVLRKYDSEMRLAERAAALPCCDFHRHYEQGPELVFPELASMRGLARLFAARAMVQSESGQPVESFRSIRVGARFAKHAGADATMIGMLVQIALSAIMDSAFQRVVLGNLDRPDVLRLAERAASDMDIYPDLRHSLRGEVIMARVCIDIVRRSPHNSMSVQILRKLGIRPDRDMEGEMTDAWEARMLSFWRRTFAALRTSKGNTMADYRAVKLVDDQEVANDGKPTYELNAVLCPVFSKATLSVAACESQRRMRHVLLALVAYHQKHRQFPASLSGLPTRQPPDVLTGRPFIYHKTDKGFIFYCVSRNLRDDGGRKETGKENGADDIAIRYPLN